MNELSYTLTRLFAFLLVPYRYFRISLLPAIMQFSRRLLYLFCIGAVLLLSFLSIQQNDAQPFHTTLERSYFEESGILSPIDSGQYFLGSIRCKGCHGYDTLQMANVDANGVDINLYDDWQTTMMANSARDPLWRAKVSHEILVNPGHAAALQTKCTSCHAPMGHFTAVYHGETNYTIEDLVNDTLGLDGVSCGGCHEIGLAAGGTPFSGNIPYDTSKKQFGPFLNPLAGPMQLYEGFTPTFSTHISKSEVCASCHTLITQSVDLDGNYTGNTFIEQATFHEWLNSGYATDNITCQKCHMPEVTDSVVIANNILALAPRSPFNQHQFSGGNAFMIKLIKENKTALGITAPDINFDSTLAATYRLLQQKTLTLTAFLDSVSTDTLFIRLRIANKAGHKFPSGYPSRRAVVQLVVTDQMLDTVFQSGTFDSNFEVKNIDPAFEPHYNMINHASQSQLYEMVMGDVTGSVTTVLERADQMLKDNRLPPEGFVSTHPVYDTVQIVGDALTDPDFNKNAFSEGTGVDFVHYHIPVSSYSGILSVSAAVYYQTVPPGYLEEMFAYSSAAIDTFRNMYFEADRTPVLMASTQLLTPVINAMPQIAVSHQLNIHNTLNQSGVVLVDNKSKLLIYSVAIYSSDGALMSGITINKNSNSIPVQLPEQKGMYLLEFTTMEGRFVFKVLRM
ncbi:MAG: T9SS type A sorting domain-containing protein [Chitinophagaceae bacterium]|nr:T9SS type A sorting domain-containing protein [Chitinophagaceae bacterium]